MHGMVIVELTFLIQVYPKGYGVDPDFAKFVLRYNAIKHRWILSWQIGIELDSIKWGGIVMMKSRCVLILRSFLSVLDQGRKMQFKSKEVQTKNDCLFYWSMVM